MKRREDFICSCTSAAIKVSKVAWNLHKNTIAAAATLEENVVASYDT